MPQTQIDMSPLCPPATASPLEKLAWLQGSLQRSESGLKNGDAYKTLDETIDLIANRVISVVKKDKKRSRVSINRIKRQLREIISLLTQRIKPRWDYGTQNEQWREQADILTKRLKAWFTSNLFDRKLKEVLQWAVCGSGYLQVGWSRAIPGYMDTDLDTCALGPDDVLRDQGDDIQSAYATHIRKLFNFSEALARFPLSRGLLRPMRTRNTTRAQDNRKTTTWLSPFLNAIGFTRTGATAGDAGDTVNSFGFLGTDVEVYYTYVLDPKLNTSGVESHSDDLCFDMMTGIKTKGTSWEYTVPYIGQQLPLDEAGHFRIATSEDCYYYPTRRLLIWTVDTLIYDGPSFFWHGRVPIVQVSMDKWPWEQIGYSLAMDNISIGEAVNQIMRGVVDSFNLKFDPTLMINGKEISKTEAKKIDLREPGGRIMRSGMLPSEDVISPINDTGYEIPAQTAPILGLMMQTMDHQIGVADVSSLMELQQAPSADSTERLLQAQGPLATDYARELEKAVTEFGYMAGWNFLQFDTLQKRLKILGQGGLSFEDFNYDPGKLLPVKVPGATVGSTLMQRGLLFGRQFSFQVVPNSIFEFTDTQDKLFKFQLWRDGRFPIDPWTLAEAWNLGNFGNPTSTSIMDRWKEWQSIEVDRQATIAAQMQLKLQQMLMLGQADMMQDPRMLAMMQLSGALPAIGGGGGESNGSSGGGRTGRPPSGGKPPHLESKLSTTNPRNPTVAES